MHAIAFSFLGVGVVFLLTGNVGVGVSFPGTGLFFFAAGAAAARKAARPGDNTEARPPQGTDPGRLEPGAAPDPTRDDGFAGR
jgi:hypothetical protein